MNNGRWVFLVIAALAIAAIVGVMAYNAGVANGIAQSGKIVMPAPGAGPGPYPYPYPYYGWHPSGFGFGFFLFPLFLFFIFAMVARAMFWRGHYRRWHHHGPCGYHEPEGAPQQQ